MSNKKLADLYILAISTFVLVANLLIVHGLGGI